LADLGGEAVVKIVLALAALLMAALLTAAPALADTRVALVIANSDYRNVAKLPNPPNDARRIADTLRKVGFATTEKNDLSKRDLEAALKVFAQSARSADVAVIYYAGHGMEQGGLNYLVPIDATLGSDQDVEFDTVPLDLLLRSVEGASRLKLVILDACRNNPFMTSMKRSGGTRAIGRGLARVEPEGDVLVAYAAREGSTADDGDGGNSPFTTALTQKMVTPGLEIRLLFGQVRDDVLKATDRRQEPAIYGSLGGDPFYFVPPAPARGPGPNRPPRATAAVAGDGPPTTPDAWRVAAITARRGGDLDKAMSAFGEALKLDPRDTEALYGRALIHVERSEWDPALADFDAVIKVRPGNAGAYHNRARAKDGKGDVDGAIADVTRAIQLNPQNDQSYVARARYYRRKSAWDLALADNNKALALQADADAYYQRGVTEEGKGDAAAALADYDKALSLDPKLVRASEAKDRLAKKK
jgi:Tfp pilus assembly protein PilF